MIRVIGVGVIAAALIAAGSAVARPAHQAKVQRLSGVVGVNDAFKISLTKGGRRVRTLKAGRYKLVVKDGSNIHNFVLEKSSGGFERAITTVTFKGTKSVTVRLTRGKWEYYCEPHESQMHGSFTVK